MRSAALFAVVVVVGFFAGRASVKAAPAAPPPPPPRVETPVQVVDALGALRAHDAAVEAAKAKARAELPPDLLKVEVKRAPFDEGSPFAEQAALEDAWRARRDTVEREGVALEWPSRRTAAADQQRVVDATRAAIVARGLDADVRAIDCSEFPCIVHFSYRGSDAAMFQLSNDLGAALGTNRGRVGACNSTDASTLRTCSLGFHESDGFVGNEGRNAERRTVRRLYAYQQAETEGGQR